LLTSFFAKSLLDFFTLRGKIQEELIFVGNIRGHSGERQYEGAVDTLRRLGAQVSAADISSSPVLRWFLTWRGYDLKQAFAGLIGLSNSLSLNATPALQINLIQRGLKLPRDYTDTDIAKIEATIRVRGTDEVRKTPSDNI
jgi:hypothetical protein